MIEFKIPEVGENIASGTVVSIYVSVGDTVTKDQDLLELETDKASLPVPSPCAGIIKEILISEGTDVNIGQVAFKIEPSGDASAQETPAAKKETAQAPVKEQAPIASKPTPTASRKTVSQPTFTPTPNELIPAASNVAAAPSVRRLARELGVQIGQVPGSGPGGRISKDDVKGFVKQIILTGGVAQSQTKPKYKPLPDFSKWGEIRKEKMAKIRQVTANHLSYCWETIPHVTQFGKADITDIEKFRKASSSENRKLTITPFLLKVMAKALREFPQFNASIDMESKEIILKEYVHIGVAVDTDRGLLVPVIRDIKDKSIFQLTDELNEMAERARNKKTGLDELRGGCITLTNLGGIYGTAFTPIVNSPEVAILGVSRGGFEPIWDKEKGEFVPRLMLPLSLSYDHRVIDGADGARFLKFVASEIEQASSMELK